MQPPGQRILDRRRAMEHEVYKKDFQHDWRGRYSEFNRMYDRDTLFDLQSGGRSKAILMSLPAEASWCYD